MGNSDIFMVFLPITDIFFRLYNRDLSEKTYLCTTNSEKAQWRAHHCLKFGCLAQPF